MGDEDDDGARFCPVCGGYMDWVSCWQCFGQGEFDLYDEDPIYYDEGDTEKCSECNGSGGYFECASLPHKEVADA